MPYRNWEVLLDHWDHLCSSIGLELRVQWYVTFFTPENTTFLENQMLLISINLKPLKPAIQLPKEKWYFPRVSRLFFLLSPPPKKKGKVHLNHPLILRGYTVGFGEGGPLLEVSSSLSELNFMCSFLGGYLEDHPT